MVVMQSFSASANTRPNFVDLANGITVMEKYRTNSNAVVCKYTRPVAPQVVNSYYNLQSPHHAVYASGNVTNGVPQYHHDHSGYTPARVTFIQLAVVSTSWLTKLGVLQIWVKSGENILWSHIFNS